MVKAIGLCRGVKIERHDLHATYGLLCKGYISRPTLSEPVKQQYSKSKEPCYRSDKGKQPKPPERQKSDHGGFWLCKSWTGWVWGDCEREDNRDACFKDANMACHQTAMVCGLSRSWARR